MLLEPENLGALAVGQDGELSGEHIYLPQFLSFFRSRPFSDVTRSEIGWELCQLSPSE